MYKKLAGTWLVVFIVWMAGSFVVHGTLLHDDYAKLRLMFRSDAESAQYFPLMLLAHVMLSGAFTWIYLRGREAKPWLAQGLRFGLVMALFTVVPTYMIYYVVQPMPGITVIKQIVYGSALLLVLGTVVAYLYREQKPA